MIRTKKASFIQSQAPTPVAALAFAIMIVGIAIPFTPFAAALNLQPLPRIYFPWLVAILFTYFMLIQLVKRWYMKKFSRWR